MMYVKIQIQKYQKINKVTQNVRNPHIHRTLPIVHFFGVFKNFWDIIWLGCCLNRFVTLGRWPNDIRRNQNPKYKKIHKGTKNVRNPHIVRTLPILHFFGLSKIFGGIIWLRCCLIRSITLRRWSNEIQKNRNPKIIKNSQGYEECEESSHCSYPLNSSHLWTL